MAPILTCFYCWSISPNLERMNNELIQMFRTKYLNCPRTAQLCEVCRGRAVTKLKHLKRKTQSAKRKALSVSSDDKTPSYSNESSSSFLSYSSNSQSPKRKQNVAIRTGGRPMHPIYSDENEQSPQEQSQQTTAIIDLFQIPQTTSSSEQTPQSASSRASSRPQLRPRSQSLTRPPTPKRILSMTSEERSNFFGTYMRGFGG